MIEGTDYHVCCGCHDADLIREGLLQAVAIAQNHLTKYHGGLHCLEHVIEEIKVAATAKPANDHAASER